MSDITYEREVELARADFVKDGYPMSKWREMEIGSNITLRCLGFSGPHEVRRIARRFIRRAAK